MPLNNPYPGHNWVAEYQVSGIPWLTSSTVPTGNKARIEFDRVTQFVSIRNDATASVRLAFTLNGLSTNYVQLSVSESLSANFRCKTLFVSGAVGAPFSIVAGMTMIDSRHFPELTGSMSGSNPVAGLG